jgi:hypothetical protein
MEMGNKTYTRNSAELGKKDHVAKEVIISCR